MIKRKNSCPICGNGNIKVIKITKNYYFCPDCLSMRMVNLPKADYAGDYYEGRSGIASKLFSPVAVLFNKIRLHYINKKHIKTWLDVGAGKGEFLNVVKAEKRIGVEISDAGRAVMKINNLDVMTPEKFLKAEGLRADVVSFWQVLEHLESPLVYLEAAKRNLKKGGRILIGVPNLNSFEFKIFGSKWFHLAPKFHIWLFSPKSMSLLLKKAGLKIEKINFWSVEYQPAGLIQSFINWSTGTYNILHKIVKRSEGKPERISTRDLLLIIFWLTFGLLIVAPFWIIEAILHKSGTFEVVASTNK